MTCSIASMHSATAHPAPRKAPAASGREWRRPWWSWRCCRCSSGWAPGNSPAPRKNAPCWPPPKPAAQPSRSRLRCSKACPTRPTPASACRAASTLRTPSCSTTAPATARPGWKWCSHSTTRPADSGCWSTAAGSPGRIAAYRRPSPRPAALSCWMPGSTSRRPAGCIWPITPDKAGRAC
ncbi:hypothetical protein D3C78_1163430 [compost metagenome]